MELLIAPGLVLSLRFGFFLQLLNKILDHLNHLVEWVGLHL
jgi:hypothetical protein